ncbi:MAG: ATP-binding cassette domain-containing protein, partial [Bacteroidota bacterium]
PKNSLKGQMILESSGTLTPDEFIVFVGGYTQLLSPAKAISNSLSNIQRGIAAGERVFEITDSHKEMEVGQHATIVKDLRKGIEIKNVHFAYEEEKVLQDINLTVEKGQTIALVGPSGSGKSTLADLIPRFYDVTEGEILIDGQNVKEYSLNSLRQLMGIVTQESILFNDTIFNNIAFGQPSASMEQVIEAAKIANAHEFIEVLENGYHTNIGERGSKLSGGQKQRLSIARAVLKNPKILILDEATSALDSESEKLVQQAIDNLMRNRTSIVIAHRLSTIQNADEIVVLQHGKILQRGKHEELLATDGLYRKLTEMQSF